MNDLMYFAFPGKLRFVLGLASFLGFAAIFGCGPEPINPALRNFENFTKADWQKAAVDGVLPDAGSLPEGSKLFATGGQDGNLYFACKRVESGQPGLFLLMKIVMHETKMECFAMLHHCLHPDDTRGHCLQWTQNKEVYCGDKLVKNNNPNDRHIHAEDHCFSPNPIPIDTCNWGTRRRASYARAQHPNTGEWHEVRFGQHECG